MAITYPREFQDCKFSSVTFELQRYMSRNFLYGGKTQSREVAEPRWAAEFVTQPLNNIEIRAWRAWWDSLDGGLKEIVAYDPYAPYPVNYARGWGSLTVSGSPFNGTGDVTALTATTIAIQSLPANFALKAGDYVGLVEGSNRSLHLFIEDATANGSGVLAASLVKPNILTSVFSASAVAHFYRPTCRMTVDPDSWSAPRGVEAQPVSFTAIQKLM